MTGKNKFSINFIEKYLCGLSEAVIVSEDNVIAIKEFSNTNAMLIRYGNLE